MKRFPSLQDIAATLGLTALRFAPVMAAALGGTACAIAWVEQPRPSAEVVAGFSSAMMALALAVPVLFAVCLYRERFPGMRGNVLLAFGAALAPVYFLSLRLAQTPLPMMQVQRFVALLAGAHFLVAVVPSLARRGDVGFWRFNERLFLRFLLGALYVGVLYVGLALALLSLDRLLSLHIPGKAYANLGVFLAGTFHPIFFLAGVPRDFEALETEAPHPAGLRRFVQFVLLPLVAVYLGILYLYAGKIALSWRLPNGWLARPVLILAVIGILAALLLEPVERSREFPWAAVFRRWFYRLLLPLMPLLFLSIGRRIHDYGFTEGRYLAVILAVWLTAMAGLFSRGRGASIKAIPLSLAVLAVLTTFGPWSAFAVSGRSQWSRLNAELGTLNLIEQGRAVPRRQRIEPQKRQQLASMVNYLLSVHDHAAVDTMMERVPAWQPYRRGEALPYSYAFGAGDAFLRALNIETGPGNPGRYFHIVLAPTGVIATPAGALVSYHSINRFPPESRRDSFVLVPDGSLRIDPSEGPGRMRLLAGNDSQRIDWAPVIDPLVGEAVRTGAVGAAPTISRGLDQLTLQRSLAGHTVKLVVTEAQGMTGEAAQVTLNQIQFLAIVAEEGEHRQN
jgi:hypothetical protein